VTGLTPGTSYTYKLGFKVNNGTGRVYYGQTTDRGPLVMEAIATV
jgi:hypothetical protein